MNIFIFTEECPGCGFYVKPSPELAKVEFIDKQFDKNGDSNERRKNLIG